VSTPRRPATSPEPVRTCVGCRGKAPQVELVRVVAADGRLRVDRRAPGRGAWLHARPDCFAAAARRRAFAHALRAEVGAGAVADLGRSLAASAENLADWTVAERWLGDACTSTKG